MKKTMNTSIRTLDRVPMCPRNMGRALMTLRGLAMDRDPWLHLKTNRMGRVHRGIAVVSPPGGNTEF